MTNPFYYYNSEMDLQEILKSIPIVRNVPEDGYRVNFLGVATPKALIPELFWVDNHVEEVPVPGNWHACLVEWGSVAHAIKNSSANPLVVELGCGWGCWMINSTFLAKLYGKKSITVKGVDGDKFMLKLGEETFNHNLSKLKNFNVNYQYVNGLIGNGVGKMSFGEQGEDITYGLKPVEIRDLNSQTMNDELPWITLKEISNGAMIDLMHIDIQGHEFDFLEANYSELNKLVKRLIIGTHSRVIEGQILKMLSNSGWTLLAERPCIFSVNSKYNEAINGHWVDQTTIDGLQYWVNDK